MHSVYKRFVGREAFQVADVTAIVLTKNEEKNLPDCLQSLRGFASRVVVVDSGSTDATCEIARAAGAEVLVHAFETHGRQFNWVLDNANIATKWTFRLDADERLTPALAEELVGLMQAHDADDTNGVVMEAWMYFMGRRLKHARRQKRKLMLFKTGLARSEDRYIDEHTRLLRGELVYARKRFLHYDFKDMNHYVAKLNWYAGREVRDYFAHLEGAARKGDIDQLNQGVRNMKYGFYYRLPMFSRCWMLFVFDYIFKLGFLDGREGFLYHYMYSRFYRTLVDAKIYEHIKNGSGFEALGALED